ncbi:hypothetical protein SADUNF_Sadunf09G0125200 [Salix dunnii]|uniref:CCHC-type domain-containing protein n=1 Tax=Salix dunnii TaxID=1413687 RepID=A0A835JRZ4_9ROSI|nr:hypothetical protein SADUNF_Sadunf09G0125200 [Salix dunnii]
MAKKERRKAKTKVIEEEEEEKQSKEFVAEATSDDEEANEDLSLKIVEKSLLMRAAKLAENGNGFVVLDDDCGGGGIRDGGAEEIELTSLIETEEAVIAKKEEKLDKFEEAETIENTEIMEKAEKSEKVEVDEAVELVEDGGANAVENSVNIVLRKLLRGPRYFDPLDSGWSNCFNCGEEGHMTVNCPTFTKKIKPCFVCGSLEHGAKQCTKGHDCFICKESGHHAKDCPQKYKGTPRSSKICLKCGGSGHEMFSCMNDYSADDLKGGKRNHALSILTLNAHRENKESLEIKSAPHDLGKARKKRKTKSKEKGITTPQKSKHKDRHIAEHLTNSSQSTPKKSRGGWIMDDPGDVSKSTPKQSKHRNGWITEDPGDVSWSNPKNHFKSPSTPSYKGHKSSPVTSDHHMSNSQTFKKNNWSHSGTSAFQGSATPYQHRYSASRFGNPGNEYENSGHEYSNSGHTYNHSGHAYSHSGPAYNSSGHAHNNSRYARDNSWYAHSNSGYVYNN